MTGLTDIQEETLNYIIQHIEENANQPTVRYLARRFNKNVRAMQDRISALREKGYIEPGSLKPVGYRVKLERVS